LAKPSSSVDVRAGLPLRFTFLSTSGGRYIVNKTEIKRLLPELNEEIVDVIFENGMAVHDITEQDSIGFALISDPLDPDSHIDTDLEVMMDGNWVCLSDPQLSEEQLDSLREHCKDVVASLEAENWL
tara:strand:+ start:6096 stop:6476 length:381 start_codon:yes stop_codon:yes gene_type:complete